MHPFVTFLLVILAFVLVFAVLFWLLEKVSILPDASRPIAVSIVAILGIVVLVLWLFGAMPLPPLLRF